LNNSRVNRTNDLAGDPIKTFTTVEGDQVQAVALVDASGAQSGVAANPLDVQGAVLSAIQNAIEALGTLANVLNVAGSVSIDNKPEVSIPDPVEVFGQVDGSLALKDGNGNAITSTLDGVQRSLDVNVVALHELISFLQTLRTSQGIPDPAGRMRASIEAGSLSTVSTVTTVTTVANMAALGGYAAGLAAMSMSNAAIAGLRGNIVIS
jgi:hypothetical protein